jgi:cytidylate kinase
MIIAIDGPAGAGKSTIAKLLAQKLGFLYIDTGAMYRALTLKVLSQNVDIEDLQTIIKIASTTDIDLLNNPDGSIKVILDGQDVSSSIRDVRITKHVSDIAKIKEVREVMVKLQRIFGGRRDSVLDGRDIGTVVFPKAEFKFYLDADAAERARRRYKELLALGKNVTLDEIKNDVTNRDTIDSTRKVGPLKKADDAIYIDTTPLSIPQVVEKVASYING